MDIQDLEKVVKDVLSSAYDEIFTSFESNLDHTFFLDP